MTDEMCIKCHKESQWFCSEFCFACMLEERKRKLTEDILSGEVESTDGEEDIVCPWCGLEYDPFEVDENYSFIDEGEYKKHCYECGHDFIYQAEVNIRFSTRRDYDVQ